MNVIDKGQVCYWDLGQTHY